MTTLPQTTGARFPRVGSRAPSIPGAMSYPGGAGGPSAGNSLTVGDALRVLRTNVPLIITFLVLSLIIGYLLNQYVFMRYYQQYTADAILQVKTPNLYDPINGGNNLFSGDRLSLEIRQKTIAQKLANPNLWQPLFQNDQSQLRQSAWVQSFKTPENTLDAAAAADAISKNLRVSPDPGSELISANLSAPTPKDAQIVLDAIILQLINNEKAGVSSSKYDERRALSNFQARLDTQVNNLTNQVSTLSSQLNMPQDKSGGGNGLMIVNQMRLQRLIEDQSQKQKDLDQANALATAYSTELAAGGTPALLGQALESDPSIQQLKGAMLNAEISRRSLRANANYSQESRQAQQAEAEYNVIKEQLEQQREQLRVSRGDALRTSLVSQSEALKSDLTRITDQIATVETNIGELAAASSKLATAIDLQKYYSDKRSKVEERLSVLEANASQESRGSGTVDLVYPIKQPEGLSFPKLRMTLGGAAMIGLALALGIAFLRELMDTTVRSPRDITKVGNLNLLGMIPHSDDDPQAAAGELALTISQSPHSIISENFRQVRTRLQHAASLDTTRSLLVTSPGPGDGKTIVACNLAAGLALNGRKILLVDANFRRPALHGIFGVTQRAWPWRGPDRPGVAGERRRRHSGPEPQRPAHRSAAREPDGTP